MLSALAAESLKLRRHKATWFLVWIYPIGVLLLSVIAITIGLVQPGDESGAPSAETWIGNTAMIWHAPASTFGRYLICAFTAVAFAGEYGWNTWKLVVPHRARWTLIAAKYAVVLALLYATFILTGVLTIVMSWLSDTLTGDPIPSGITAGALIEAQWVGAVTALAPILLTVAYTSLAAVLTRSMVAALVIGIIITTAEQMFGSFAPMLSFQAPQLVPALYQGLPGYHVANLMNWIGDGGPLRTPFPDGTVVAYSWGASLAVAGAWIAALVALTLLSFKRQDIN